MAPSIAFFSNNSTTQAECDRFAETVLGGPAAREKPHGAYSYTVVAQNDPVVVQFRESGSSPLPDPDTPLFQAFVAAHPHLVPVHQLVGTVGTLNPYRMPKLPGVSSSDANVSYYLKPSNKLALAEDLAQFFVRSLQIAQLSVGAGPSYERGAIKDMCLQRLRYLSGSLPSRFRDAVKHVTKHIDDLFDPNTGCPCVATHGDLSKTNILVDSGTGNLTGVVDLAELDCLPFGFDFYVIDEMVGEWRPDGWTEHADAAAVRTHFWNKLLSLTQLAGQAQGNIKLARLAGILFRYGTRYDAGFPGMLGTRSDSGVSIQILDGLVGQNYPQ